MKNYEMQFLDAPLICLRDVSKTITLVLTSFFGIYGKYL